MRGRAVLAVVGAFLALAPTGAAAASPSPIPCYTTLKFAGSLYLDADSTVPQEGVGAQVGVTDPNPAHCGVPDREPVYRATGHNTSEEVVYFKDGKPELFRFAGSTGFPFQDALKWLVLGLLIVVIVFAGVPGIYAHLKAPPVEVGGAEDPPGL